MEGMESALLRRIYDQARRDGYSPREARAVQVLCSQGAKPRWPLMEKRARAILGLDTQKGNQ